MDQFAVDLLLAVQVWNIEIAHGSNGGSQRLVAGSPVFTKPSPPHLTQLFENA